MEESFQIRESRSVNIAFSLFLGVYCSNVNYYILQVAGGYGGRGLKVPGASAGGGKREGRRCYCSEEEGGLGGGGQDE